jgi:3-phenylpropionate/cinnamic acid dioxygenase small subunit
MQDLKEATDVDGAVHALYARYAEAICDGRLEEWPEFFTDACLYKVISRANQERNLPLAPIFSETKGGLIDRVRALRTALVYAPRSVCYVVGTIGISERTREGVRARSMFSAYHTFVEGDSTLLMCGRTFDRIVRDGSGLKFKERVVVYDNDRVPSALVYPL